ncbi:MAG: apolipoprotein N-acyltransferase [Vicinamibacteria bacterium]
MSLARRACFAALAGALLASAFPKIAFAPAAFVALVPLLLAVQGATPGHGFLLGWIAGTTQGFLLLFWVSDVLTQFGGVPLPMALLLNLLLALAFGLFLGAFGWLLARVGVAFGSRSLLAAPFLFVTCEFLREFLLFGFPWCLLGYSQIDFPELIQIASFTAVHGVSFLLAASSAGIAHAFVGRTPFERRLGVTIPALLISGAMGYGHARLQDPIAEGGGFTVGVIQAAIPQDQKWDGDLLQSNIEQHLALSREAIARGAKVVIWPESAIGYELDLYPEARKQITDFTETEGVYLLTGNDDRLRDRSGVMRSYVGAKMISPSGRIAMRYHKMRLVPFGEYLPLSSVLRKFASVGKLVQGVSDFTPGDVPATTSAFGVSLGAFICYEAIFPSLVRRFPANGADVLFNLTNDGWYGTSAAPYQHYAMARFRAVENHRFLVRAANTGISAIIDPLGREIAHTDLMERTTLVGDVRAVKELTFYARHGDVFAWTVAALALLSLLAAWFVTRPLSNKLAPSQTAQVPESEPLQ